MKTMYRPCKGCRHRKVRFRDWLLGEGDNWAICKRPEVQELLVTEVEDLHLGGRKVEGPNVLCRTARGNRHIRPESRRCGRDARYFEHKAEL